MIFIDLVKTSVESNFHLSISEKLNNLKVCVNGEAPRIISSTSITDANYNIALTLLKDRYENKRSIIQTHLQAYWSQPVLKTESAPGLRKLLELTNEHIRALVELGQPVERWNAILVFCSDRQPTKWIQSHESSGSWIIPTLTFCHGKYCQNTLTQEAVPSNRVTNITPEPRVTPPCNQGSQTLTKKVQSFAVQGSSS